MTYKEYKKRYVEYQEQVIKEMSEGTGDEDIQNLTDIMYSIMPGSRWFRWGYISSLKKAIDALKFHKGIIHCKDCEYLKQEDGIYKCRRDVDWEIECYDCWLNVKPNDFCPYGEKRGESHE